MDSNAGYTNGPWTAHAYNSYMGTLISHGDISNGQTVANAFAQKDAEEGKANARLIAAAPTGHELIARAVADRIDDQWLKEASAYLEAVNGNS